MPGAEFFARWGLFVRRACLDRDVCARVIEDMRAAGQEPARVYRQTVDPEVDTRVRKTTSADVSEEAGAVVEQALNDLRPELSAHFGVKLESLQPLDFLLYRTGDFFEAHSDGGSSSTSDAPVVAARRVSAVIFLNDSADRAPAPEGQFSGGQLTFKLMDDPRARHLGFPLEAEAGLLVAFTAELVHEVTVVTSGERFTVVAFFE